MLSSIETSLFTSGTSQIRCYLTSANAEEIVKDSSNTVGLSVKSSCIKNAAMMFDAMPVRNTVCMNALLWGYSEAKMSMEGLALVRKMPCLNLVDKARHVFDMVGFSLSRLAVLIRISIKKEEEPRTSVCKRKHLLTRLFSLLHQAFEQLFQLPPNPPTCLMNREPSRDCLSHISRIYLNNEPVASDDRPHATIGWASNSYPPNISFYPSRASTMKNMLRPRDKDLGVYYWTDKVLTYLTRSGEEIQKEERRDNYRVQYQSGQFLDKNKDYVAPGHQDLLSASKCPFVVDLFPPVAEESTKSSSKSSKFSSIGSRFKLQLQSLMETLNSTEPHYIRCVKPNNLLKPAIFENVNIVQQLRCCGVLEAIRISCAGYPTYKTFSEFMN
ncbi:hypothetical protein T459_23418 [Capsicum annuum]|uniref:Myosin motor domain-containing protein n=1 Tax=Capsicum annuum TaxID=4072 RepID=A0A2G2YSB6_CAPAN|nr:hypothetical protein FXO37_06766 [Capsicum annuum]PHT72633.1 hypothetical protein T459_23418 [Capsicum annuum]